MEAELRPALERARERDVVGPGGDGRMKWDDHLCHLLTPALAAYENQAVTGIAPGAFLQNTVSLLFFLNHMRL